MHPIRPFFFTIFLCLALSAALSAQSKELTYYLPDLDYDQSIPTPESVLGFQIGDWHITHTQQYMYMRELAAASPRLTLVEYARSYEDRPLIYLAITSVANQGQLDQLRQAHLRVSDPSQSAKVDLANTPTVLYQGFSIHGNEPSGGNAAPLVAYYLAAAPESAVGELLDKTIILLDPCYNPDGFQRFSTWANMHKNVNMTANPNDREYDEVWPGGRTNHYWFDLNRDWLPVQHPESQGRIKTFHDWKPNVLTDHHEMGTNATFFFMPGEPTRVHPITPSMNQELTARIGDYHVVALDKIGSLYYSGEGYDDYYMGKGSTYPDANGTIGILFEQASSRGHLQESDNGILSFPFTVRNQVTTSLSTLAAMEGLHDELLGFQRDFFRTGIEEARASDQAAFVFGSDNDPGRAKAFLDILHQHQVKVYELDQDTKIGDKAFAKGKAYVVPTNQTQHRLVRVMFETIDTFEDSLFYDVSTWTLPYAFNLDYAASSRGQFKDAMLGKEVMPMGTPPMGVVNKSDYAYLLRWNDYYAPQALSHVLRAGLRAKVTHGDFKVGDRSFERGTIMIPVANQDMSADEIQQLMTEVHRKTGVVIEGVPTGMTVSGVNLGSRIHSTLRNPEVLLLIGEGISSYDAGEVWHLLDQRYDIVVTKGDVGNFRRLDLERYNTIIMVDFWYSQLNKDHADDLKAWVRNGGTLITNRGASSWAARNGLAHLKTRNISRETTDERRPYDQASRDQGGRVLGGSIFQTNVDLTHPLLYGYQRAQVPVFKRGNLLFEPADNPYASPMIYADEPFLSGYVHRETLDDIGGAAAAIVSGHGSGRVISLADNMNFRAFFYGTNKILANAIFFGHTIAGGTTQNSPPANDTGNGE